MTPSLFELPVLIVDCQTTGASPRTGHLLDLGWCVTRAADPVPASDRITDHLVRLPPGAAVPRPVSKLTGITTGETRAGLGRDRLWRDLGAAAAALQNGEGAFCVAHYARFEEGFLRALHAECAPLDAFPLRFLCTHEISRRLFPDLPRRSLRVVAGLFGSPAPELKRAQGHVAATISVWSGLVRRLRDDHGVETLDDLRRLLAEPPRARGGRWTYPLPREQRLALPDRPGVYRFLGGDGSVLYVGKARSLRARVNSYYRHRRPGDKVLELVSQAVDVETTVTASALEAALLEAAEIQRLGPRYNRALRVDDTRVWFFSPGFESARTRPDRAHRRGPFPDRRPFAVLRALSMLLSGELPRAEATRALNRALDLPGRRREGVLAAGVDLLAGRHGWTPDASRVGLLLATGRRLALERTAIRAAAGTRAGEAVSDAGEPETAATGGDEAPAFAGGLFGADQPEPGRGSTPESVADWLEGSLVHASKQVSRARWFTLLANSTLCWRPADASLAPPTQLPPPRRALILHRGSIALTCNLLLGETPPGPDRAGYDRLRVLTTEIRRLLAEGRDVELHLVPRTPRGKPRRLGTRLLRRVMERL